MGRIGWKPTKIVVAADKFKGSLSSQEVADTIGQAIEDLYPSCEVVKISVSDGGDGLMEALIPPLGGRYQTVETVDPLMRRLSTCYGILPDNTAVIELAAASGLALLRPDEYNPMLTNTFGTGQIIASALQQGITDFIIGIGGSATNDAATGLLHALGFRFRDKNRNELQPGGRILKDIAYIDSSSRNPLLDNARFRIACDVDNPFSGKKGAAYIFAPQKGADAQMVEELDKGLEHFASVIKEQFACDIRHIPGAGAAGGVGGAALAFLNARLVPGIDLVLDTLSFDDRIKNADLIITGEGRIDAQTLHGKTVKGVSERAGKQHIPVIAFAGAADDFPALEQQLGLEAIHSINPPGISLEEAMQPEVAKANLYRAVYKKTVSL